MGLQVAVTAEVSNYYNIIIICLNLHTVYIICQYGASNNSWKVSFHYDEQC